MKMKTMAFINPLILIHRHDNVAVALKDLDAGLELETNNRTLKLSQNVPQGHKVAFSNIKTGENIIKYGYPIGRATADIQQGEWVHTHNIATGLKGTQVYTYEPDLKQNEPIDREIFFDGYKRTNSSAGIRNEIWIIPMSGCANKFTENLVLKFSRESLKSNIDGIFSFPHPYGCSQIGTDHEITQKILAGLAKNPNAGGVFLVGLGCENNTMESFLEVLGDYDPDRVRFMVMQEVDNEMKTGVEILNELVEYAGQFRREPVPLSSLVVGLECGGSDGLSGITANPLLGVFSDRLIAFGGSAVLTEVPEMFGAEQILMNRCASEEIFDRCVDMINGFKKYFIRYNQNIYENPSPGNKAGGISTLEEKSLGCILKCGGSPVVDVLTYGEQVQKKGLNLLNGPGNDMISVTLLAAAGAQLVLFTTGRGTPFGGPVPTVKISTNTHLSVHKKHWIDFNAGKILEGAAMEEMADELLKQVLTISSGQKNTLAEDHGYREIALFKDGVIL